MTSPRAERDLLMFWASLRAVPVAPERGVKEEGEGGKVERERVMRKR
jgi:hypothetical protein